MKGTLKVGSVAGIPIRLHWSMVILIVFALSNGTSQQAAIAEFAWIVMIFALIVVHELAHCLVAQRRGHIVRDVLLMPLGGISEIIGIGSSPSDELAIAIAGPMVNGVVALVLTLVSIVFGIRLWPPTLFTGAWLARAMWANVVLGAFNLLPAIPLDGGRVLRAMLATTRDRATATVLAARIATVVGALMIVTGLVFDLWMCFIGVIVLFGARAERQSALLGALLTNVKVRDVMVNESTGLDLGMSYQGLASLFQVFPRRAFLVLKDGRVCGIVTADDLAVHSHARQLAEVMDTASPLLRPDDDIYPTALDALLEASRTALGVADAYLPRGVLYASDIASLVESRTGTGSLRGQLASRPH